MYHVGDGHKTYQNVSWNMQWDLSSSQQKGFNPFVNNVQTKLQNYQILILASNATMLLLLPLVFQLQTYRYFSMCAKAQYL